MNYTIYNNKTFKRYYKHQLQAVSSILGPEEMLTTLGPVNCLECRLLSVKPLQAPLSET